VRRVKSAQSRPLIEPSFRLQNLAANLTGGICGCVEIEIPLTLHQFLSLFRCQGSHPFMGLVIGLVFIGSCGFAFAPAAAGP
jgi:hypothetical protein